MRDAGAVSAQAARSARLDRCIPLLIGAVAFLVVAGPRILYPWNIGWLAHGDAPSFFLGWEFFRHAPWSWPLGLNPDYGLELSSAVVYSDSPGLAILFKLAAPLLPEPFQYFGLWVLACFVLQAWFAWLLLGLATAATLPRALATALFVFSPPMIWRLHPAIAHLSLVAHFLVVAALFLALRPAFARRRLAWGSLLVAAALIHAYLLAMVLAIWGADLAGRCVRGELAWRRAPVEAGVLAIALGLALWQAGYFTVGGGFVAPDAEFFRMNLLAPLDPGKAGYGRLSWLLPDLPGDEAHHEGFNYLGLGFIALLLGAAPAALRLRPRLAALARRHVLLLAVLAGLAVFALSNRIALGAHELEIPLADFLLRGAAVFRACARMFWPAFYALLLAAAFVVIRGYPRPGGAALLALALAVQVVDTSAGWRPIRAHLAAPPAASWSTPLVSPFWDAAAARYRKVRWLPTGNASPHWMHLAAWAGGHRLATDAVYVARLDPAAMDRLWDREQHMLLDGVYDADTLYVLDDSLGGFAAASLHAETDLLARVDGLLVLAPGWRRPPS